MRGLAKMADAMKARAKMGVRPWARFVRYSFPRQRLLVEAAAHLGFARLALALFPFRRISKSLGQPRLESPSRSTNALAARAAEIGWAVETMSRYTIWDTACLTQAIAVTWMLKRRGIPSTLYLGTAMDDARALTAHAWVRSGTHILTGSTGHERYSVIAFFSSDSNVRNLTPSQGSSR
jgi:hypothetical protein